MRKGILAVAATAAAVLAAPTAAGAQGAFVPPNPGDLFALGAGMGQPITQLPVQSHPEPPLTATPLVKTCSPGDKPQPGVDGRVPKDAAVDGLNCNVSLVGHTGNAGGFRVWRYVDTAGHECAFYDTALLYPSNAFNAGGGSQGVDVLDMSDPANPRKTANLSELPMMTPHESLNFNEQRGLLAAVSGNPSTEPGFVSIYDASADCRYPVLQSTSASAQLGHESGFSADGKTFYATSTAFPSVTAIDVTDPKAPRPIWVGQVSSHGLTLSDDGNRAYVADATNQNLTILDTSQIQARVPDPQVSQISRLTWGTVSIPQNAVPFTVKGHPYLLEFDEYADFFNNNADRVGAARIIDIADERSPKVIANLRLGISQPEAHAAADGDPGTQSTAQGYGAHYCNLSSRVDPKVVACSFIASGLRVFDISKLTKPKQIGYYVAPTIPAPENFSQASAYAMSQPQIIPSRKEIWYSDGTSGFYVLRVADRVWPAAQKATRTVCSTRFTRRFTVRRTVRSVRARVGGKRVKARRRGHVIRVSGRLPRKRVVKVKVRARVKGGKLVRRQRTLRPCRQL